MMKPANTGPKSMKILIVINSIIKGGRERRMLELIKGLKSQGDDFDICLVSLTNVIDYDYVYKLPISLKVLDKKDHKDFKVVFELRKIIKDFDPDIIHSWDVTASGYLVLAKMFTRSILINGFIADASNTPSLLNKINIKIRLLSFFSKAIISNSFAGIRAYRTPRAQSVCIYNGIDFKRFENLKPVDEITMEILGAPKGDRFIAAMVAAFEIRKDYQTLAKAAVTLCNKHKNAVFFFIGEGSEKEAIKAVIPAGLLNTQVFFLGMRHDIESILQIIDVGLLVTNSDVHAEGISNSIIEYMASAKPVIATRGGGTDELVKEGVNGFLLLEKNPDHLVSSVERLIDNHELAVSMGKKGFELVHEQFDVHKMTATYIDLYRKLRPAA